MEETIVIDCSSRLWLAGIVGRKGGLAVAPVELNGFRNPYMWAEVLLDKEKYTKDDEEFLEFLVNSGGSVDDNREELGCYLDGEAPHGRVMPIRDPLHVLSEPYASLDHSVWLCRAAVKSLMFLLCPLVKALRRLGIVPEKRPAIAIAPSFLGRTGMACLLAALRGVGVRRARIIPRSLAVGLYGTFVVGAEQCMSIDSHEEGMTVRRLNRRFEDDVLSLTLDRSWTLPGAGWPEILDAIREKEPSWDQHSVRQLLFGTVSGTPAPTLRWDAMESFLAGAGGDSFRLDLGTRLIPAAGEFGWPGAGLAFSGMCFAAPGAERMVRTLMKAGDPFDESLVIERPARGVAAMVEWLRSKPGRRVDLRCEYGIFLRSGGHTHRMIHSNELSNLSGVEKAFKRLGMLSVPAGRDMEFLDFNLVQGIGDISRDRASIGIYSQVIDFEGDAYNEKLTVRLVLKGNGNKGRIRGTASVGLGEHEEKFHFRLINPEIVFSS